MCEGKLKKVQVEGVGGGGSFKICLFIFGLGVMGYWVLEEGVFGFFLKTIFGGRVEGGCLFF